MNFYATNLLFPAPEVEYKSPLINQILADKDCCAKVVVPNHHLLPLFGEDSYSILFEPVFDLNFGPIHSDGSGFGVIFIVADYYRDNRIFEQDVPTDREKIAETLGVDSAKVDWSGYNLHADDQIIPEFRYFDSDPVENIAVPEDGMRVIKLSVRDEHYDKPFIRIKEQAIAVTIKWKKRFDYTKQYLRPWL